MIPETDPDGPPQPVPLGLVFRRLQDDVILELTEVHLGRLKDGATQFVLRGLLDPSVKFWCYKRWWHDYLALLSEMEVIARVSRGS